MSSSHVSYKEIHKELEELVLETFGLWDENRVAFRWRHYLPNHTCRVRSMCIELGKCEGGNLIELEFAGTLHDITKPYDGVILRDKNGERAVDGNGFWGNEVLIPARNNIVTELYDKHNLYGSIHHISGAFIAGKILEKYELDREFIDDVCSIIKAHVKPLNLTSGELDRAYAKVENQIIYDADTIDANLGYVAFFRNVHIHAHRAIQRGTFDMKDYIDSMEKWVEWSRNIAASLFTKSGREMAEKRQERKQHLCKELIAEEGNFGLNMKYGMLGVIDYLVSQTADPNFTEELNHLQNIWIPQRRRWIDKGNCSIDCDAARQSLSWVIGFCRTIKAECHGKE